MTFLEEVKSFNIEILLGNFPSEISPRHLAQCPDAALSLKNAVANKKILIGGQSASQRMLKIMRRAHTVKDIEDSIMILNSAGFLPIVDILFGIPGEKFNDRMKS